MAFLVALHPFFDVGLLKIMIPSFITLSIQNDTRENKKILSNRQPDDPLKSGQS
ncbi:hypothetical protein NOC27_3329 [Nitrosococcus oceani AFC27]|nr:hypothetical protein NOC27_3329 [Nitrosococcus oceani AFC27]